LADIDIFEAFFMQRSKNDLQRIGTVLCDWFDENGRDLPWRHTRDPYAVWVSEVMLQQTRVETVLRYYDDFMEAFPTVEALARAPEEVVLKAWEGLGYYRRARYLQRGARYILEERKGEFPRTPEELRKVPGIGEYCAGSIASLAFGVPVPAVDGNVLRVLSRIHRIEDPIDRPAGRQTITDIALAMIPSGRVWSHNQALMELGALVCLPKVCRESICPVRNECLALRSGMTETLPVKSARKEATAVERRIYLCIRDNRILVRQRQKGDGLLEGLWEFPGEDADSQAGSVWPFALSQEPSVLARHVFTHRIWEMKGYEVLWPEGLPLPPHCRWADREELFRLPFPSAMKTFLAWADMHLE